MYNELHSSQLLLWKKVNKDATKPTDGCPVLTHPDSSMLGASSKWNTTGALQKGLWRTSSWHWCLTACGGTKQCFFINSNVTSTHFSVVSLVFSYGVWNRLGHTWSTLWNNKMKQWSMKKLCGAIKGLYAPTHLICFIAWFMGHDVALKRPTLLHNFQHFFFLQVERLLLLQAYWNTFFLLHKHLCRWWVFSSWWWFQCNVVFIRSVWSTLLNLSMITFLWKCCLYHCDIFLPTFCQYLGWKVAYYIQLFFFLHFLSDL